MNDGSTDDFTNRYIDQLNDDEHFRVIVKANGGLSSARNAGLDSATGDFVLFLDADDFVESGYFAALDNLVSKKTDSDVYIFNYLLVDVSKNYYWSPDEATIHQSNLNLEGFLYKWERGLTVPIHSAVFRRSFLKRHRIRFHTGVKAKEDWIFWCTAAAKGARFHFHDQPMACYRVNPDSMTKDFDTMAFNWAIASGIIISSGIIGDDVKRFREASTSHFTSYYLRAIKHFAIQADKSRSLNIFDKLSNLYDIHGARMYWPAAQIVTARLKTRMSALNRDNIHGQFIRLVKKLQLFFKVDSDYASKITFSVIVPVYNHSEFLPECLDSIMGQSHRPFEVIAIDDNSTQPEIKKILNIYDENNPNFVHLSNDTNLGIAASMNKAARSATGRWLVFVDCDDALRPEALKKLARAISAVPSAGYVFTDRERMTKTGRRMYVEYYGGRLDLLRKGLRVAIRHAMVASHLKAVRRDRFWHFQGYDESLSGVQDWDMALTAVQSGEVLYLPSVTYRYRWHPASVTLSQNERQWRLANAARRKHQKANFTLGADDRQVLRNLGSKDNVIEFLRSRGYQVIEQLAQDMVEPLTDKVFEDPGAKLAYVNFSKFDALENGRLRFYNSLFDILIFADSKWASSLNSYLYDAAAILIINENR